MMAMSLPDGKKGPAVAHPSTHSPQLLYCPRCGRLIRPSSIADGEWLARGDAYIHAGCRTSAVPLPPVDPRAATASLDFEADTALPVDFSDFDRVVRDSISPLRGRPAPAGQPAHAAHSGGRRKAAAVVRAASPVRRRNRKIPSSALLLGGLSGVLVLVLAAWLLLHHSTHALPTTTAETTPATPATSAKSAPAANLAAASRTASPSAGSAPSSGGVPVLR
ncbi:MAG: hypothetical protein ACREJ2_03015, partial [Planctomycetota bacterium]